MKAISKFSPLGGVREGLLFLALLIGAPMSNFSANYYEAPAKAKKQEVAVQSTIKDLRPAPEKSLDRKSVV